MSKIIKSLGVIPARGGSKGVRRKNIKMLGGKPLITYTINACKKSKNLTRTIISTEDREISEIALSAGADVPFIRPKHLASDSALAIDVILHAVRAIERSEGERYDIVVMLQPTTPFRSSNDIDESIALLRDSGADSVISVTEVGGHHPARMKFLEDGMLVETPLTELIENQPRQSLKPMYIRNGAIYATRRKIIFGRSFKGQYCRAWIMQPFPSQNLDTEFDFSFAEWSISERLV